MNSFEHVNATSVPGAIRLLGPDRHALPIAGGTDLLARMKLCVTTPSRLVNLKTIPGLDGMRFDEANGLTLGALADLDAIARMDAVRGRYQALFMAIESAASPQLRNMGTIGGNLVQAPRCWYYRGPFHCWLKWGDTCHAREGENVRHAIFAGGPCYAVHPSDPAPALVALGAEVAVAGASGEHGVALEHLFQRPCDESRRLTALGPSDIIVEIKVPVPAAGSRSIYLKAMERHIWSFALASIAALLTLDGDTVQDVRLVLGGVAAVPWRLQGAEDALRGSRLDDWAIDRAAKAAVEGAHPLDGNRYKIRLVQGLVREALKRLNTAE